jgi:4-hydroxythreonine-4-phosphate dehydrogenase
LLTEQFKRENELTLIGNIETITDYLSKLHFDFQITNNLLIIENSTLRIINIKNYGEVNFGKIDAKSGKAAFDALELAAQLALGKDCDALVTLPISKTAMHLAGFNFPGHTEYLAHIDSVENPLMILFNQTMKVALATIHSPISRIPKLIKSEMLTELIIKFNDSLKNDFGYSNPKIAVLGLNPHAGEEGNIGNEEIEIIKPVINSLQNINFQIDGPFSADGFFGQRLYKEFDGIFAMYHDQGLIPMKMTSLNGGVNFTAGLSFVRTSPDHGTGFDIAGMNFADPKSTYQAIIWAEKIANIRNNHNTNSI